MLFMLPGKIHCHEKSIRITGQVFAVFFCHALWGQLVLGHSRYDGVRAVRWAILELYSVNPIKKYRENLTND